MTGQVVDPERYGAILRAGASELARGMVPVLIGLIVYALLLGRTRDQRARGMAASVAAILAFAAFGYGFTYLTTRADLTWILTHSMERLELQLWPSVLLAVLLYVASPSEREAAVPRQASARRPPANAGPRRNRRSSRC